MTQDATYCEECEREHSDDAVTEWIYHTLKPQWQDAWNGVDTYISMLTYLSFMGLGIALGAAAMTSYTIVRTGHTHPGLNVTTKQVMGVGLTLFLLSHIVIVLVEWRRG